MAKSSYVNIDLNQNQILNVVLQVLGSDPVSPLEGQFWYNADAEFKKIKFYNGTSALEVATTDELHEHINKPELDLITDAGSGNIITTEERNKLSGIADGAEVNQNAFSSFSDGINFAIADKKTDTFTLRTDNIIDVIVTNDHPIYGDSALFTIQEGNINHGNLSGLDNDDHKQYILVDGTRSFTGPVSGVTPSSGSNFATKDYVDSLLQGLDWQESVIDRHLTVPPENPVKGDRYLIASNATGNWVGHDSEIAEWDGSSWIFTSPDEGFCLWVENENIQVTYNGIDWVTFGSTTNHAALAGLQGGTDGEYFHLTSDEYTDLTDGENTVLHYHGADRDLSNATGVLDIINGGTNNNIYTINKFLIYNGIKLVSSDYDNTSFASADHNHDTQYLGISAKAANADLLDEQEGIYYLNWNNFINIPSTFTPSAHDLAGSEHNSSTLAELNAKISDATLIDTTDSRLSNARTPTIHGNETHNVNFITVDDITFENLNLNGDVGTEANQLAQGDHTHALNDISNVTLTSVTGNEILIYNSITANWINQSLNEIGIETVEGSQLKVDAHANRTDNPHNVTASQLGADNILNQIKSVDGANSELDADLLDGLDGTYYLNWNNFTNTPTTLFGYGITDAASDTELNDHIINTISVHGIADTSDLAIKSGSINQFIDIDSPGEDIEDAVSKRHIQNTDIGTNSNIFQIGTNGPIIKNNLGNFQLRNSSDSTYVDLIVNNLTVHGTTTTINSETVTFNDSILVLNNNYDGSTPTENGGIEIERGTLVNASFIWDESNLLWKAGLKSEEKTLVQEGNSITLSGDISGIADFESDGNINILATVVDDSHNHIISNIDGLQSALDEKALISHLHGNITNNGAIGSISGLPIITTTNGVLSTGSFGSTEGTFCEGNDSRLSDSRFPTLHKHTHSIGGSDVLTPADIGAATDDHNHDEIYLKSEDFHEIEVMNFSTSGPATHGYKIFTNIPTGNYICKLRIEGCQDGYNTNNVLALLSWYYYNNNVYAPRYVSLASDDQLTEFYIGVENNKIVVYIDNPGFYTNFRILFLNYGDNQPPEDALNGWYWVDEEIGDNYTKALGGFAWHSGNFYPSSKSDINHNHDSDYLGINAKAVDSDKLDGLDSTAFVLVSDYENIDVLEKIKTVDGVNSGLDADLLDGLDSTAFSLTTHNHDSAYLGINAKAADSDKLDGLDGTYYLNWNNFTNTPTTLVGYGITDAASDTELNNHNLSTTSVHGIMDTADLALKSNSVNQFADITSTGADIEDAVSKRHNQNTDVGTDSTTFYIGISGPKIKSDLNGLQVRNNADSDYADLIVNNLIVNGTTTTVNSETVTFSDNILTLNNNYSGSAPFENGGIEVERGTLTNASFIWDESGDLWKAGLKSAEKTLVTEGSNVTLSGDVTGTADFDVSGNLNLTATVADDSHSHVISNVDGLQLALDEKAPISHTHGNITNSGAIGSVSGLPIITTTNGVLTTGLFSNMPGTFCAGDDPRLSDDRVPVVHDNMYHSVVYITSADVTFENLSANGDVGVGATQVAQGDHTHTLDSISDTTITDIANGEILTYNSTTTTWINQTLAEAGIAAAAHNHDTEYLGINAKAADADLLDGLDSTAFVTKSILTTKGDMYIHDGSSVTRLPVGNDNQVLTADSTQTAGVKWAQAWTNSNDGSDSGLDADMVDGKHASAFVLITDLQSNGGTILETAAIGKAIGDLPQYEDDGSGNPVLNHPNMPLVGGLRLGGVGDFAFKEGPVSLSSAYINNWDHGNAIGQSLSEEPQGIRVNETGYYRCSYYQRANGTANTYGGLAENGVRATLENREGSMWNHSHAEHSSEFVQSEYLGLLYAGELVTAGANSTTNADAMNFGNTGYIGTLHVIRIR